MISGRASYRITVQGHLDLKWWDCIGGMKVRTISRADGAKVTVLTGRLADQAALSGVLKTLHDLELPLVAVDRLDNGSD